MITVNKNRITVKLSLVGLMWRGFEGEIRGVLVSFMLGWSLYELILLLLVVFLELMLKNIACWKMVAAIFFLFSLSRSLNLS
ncbi:hypothetical protein P8610_19655 [Fictibacillus sp. UD]